MTKIKVLLAYGGQSSEHEVSIASARNVAQAIDTAKYDVILCYIDRDGQWWLQDKVGESSESNTRLLPMLGQKSFLTMPGQEIITPDVCFPVLHGHNGEDGSVQGLMQLVGLPYAGPSLLSAAVTMDKDMTKRLLEREGIPVVPWEKWLSHDQQPSYESVTSRLGSDVFVKPASAGSSVGVSHVTSADSWNEALRLAAESSEVVLIEQTIRGREVEVAVLGNAHPEVTAPGEIIVSDDFYSYEAKYSDESTSVAKIPADLPEDVQVKLKKYALHAFAATEGRGMARVDFFVTADGEIYLNEINSIPGFTDISMYPKLWQNQGLLYSDLVDRLIMLALE